MDILHAASHLLQSARRGGDVPVKLSFENLPAELQGKPLKLEVMAQLSDGKVQVKLADGQVLKATIDPPLPAGTRLTVTTKLTGETLQVQVSQLKLPPAPPAAHPTPATPQATPPAASPQTALTAALQILTPQPTQQPQVLLSYPQTGAPLHIPTLTPLQGSIASPAVAGQTTQSIQLQLPQTGGAGGQTMSVQANITLPQPLPQNTTLTLIQPQSGAPFIQSAALPANAVLHSPTPPPVLVSAVTIQTTGAHAAPHLPLNVPLTATPTAGATPVLGGVTQPVILSIPTMGQAHSAPLTATLTLNTPLQPQQTLTLQQVAPQNFVALSLSRPAQPLTFSPASPSGTPSPLTPPLHTSAKFAPLPQVKTLLPPHNTPVQALVTASDTSADGQTTQATLRLQDGLQMTIKTNTPLTAGQTVELTLKPDGSVSLTPLVLENGSQRAQVAYHFAKEWSLLKQALSVLSQGASSGLEHKAQASLPRPDTLLPTLLQFANAVHQTSAEKFLGDDTVRLLRAFGVDLAPDLTHLNHLTQRADTPDSWRGLLFPYVENHGEDPQQGGFFWRRQQEEGENEHSDADAVRFVLQLELSALGPMQLDGLMQNHHINLKLRIKDLPEENFQHNLRELVHETLAGYGLTGSIAVERTANFPFNPLAEIQHQSGTFTVES